MLTKADKSYSVKNILVVSGGFSDEREVSLSSGKECSKALSLIGYNVLEFDFTTLDQFLNQMKDFRPDVVFNALHGRWGESGPFQGILDTLKVPYTHSGVLSSALAMNKHMTKIFLRQDDIPTPSGFLISNHNFDEIDIDQIDHFPCVVKPNDQGSSLGVSIIRSPEELTRFVTLKSKNFEVFEYTDDYILEKYISGRELTTAIVDNTPLGVTEIITKDWYDYDSKYIEGRSTHIVPANIPNYITELCKKYALKTHKLLGCRGISRVDFRWDDSLGQEGLFVLEMNTQPGMTPTSLVPEQAAEFGISFEQLCKWIVEDASYYR